MKRRAPIFAIVGAMVALMFGAPAMAASPASQASGSSLVSQPSSVAPMEEPVGATETCWAKNKVYYFKVYGHAYIDSGKDIYYIDKLTLSTTSTARQDAYYNIYDNSTGQRLWGGYSLDWVGSTHVLVRGWFQLPYPHYLRLTVSTTEGALCEI